MPPNARTRVHVPVSRTNTILLPQGLCIKKTYLLWKWQKRLQKCSETPPVPNYPQFKVYRTHALCPTAYAFAQSCIHTLEHIKLSLITHHSDLALNSLKPLLAIGLAQL